MPSFEDKAGAFMDVAAAAGDLCLVTHMSLLFPSARGEKHHERALKTAMEAGQLHVIEALIKAGVDPHCMTMLPAHNPCVVTAASSAAASSLSLERCSLMNAAGRLAEGAHVDDDAASEGAVRVVRGEHAKQSAVDRRGAACLA